MWYVYYDVFEISTIPFIFMIRECNTCTFTYFFFITFIYNGNIWSMDGDYVNYINFICFYDGILFILFYYVRIIYWYVLSIS